MKHSCKSKSSPAFKGKELIHYTSTAEMYDRHFMPL